MSTHPTFLLFKRNFRFFINDAPIGEAEIVGSDEKINPVIYSGADKVDARIQLTGKRFILFTDKDNFGDGSLAYWPDGVVKLHGLYIKEQYRNKGYGNLLLGSLIKVAKEDGCKSIHLDVRKTNQVAIHLYEKFGFTQSIIQKWGDAGWNYELVLYKDQS
jgi:ribosomal protein S18 acetylase RimI-like enzyme